MRYLILITLQLFWASVAIASDPRTDIDAQMASRCGSIAGLVQLTLCQSNVRSEYAQKYMPDDIDIMEVANAKRLHLATLLEGESISYTEYVVKLAEIDSEAVDKSNQRTELRRRAKLKAIELQLRAQQLMRRPATTCYYSGNAVTCY